jgi:hypothetical protein
MKEERYKYFDDEELEALMEEVERSGMIAPPVYLKELIMEEAVHGTACGKTKWNHRGRCCMWGMEWRGIRKKRMER